MADLLPGPGTGFTAAGRRAGLRARALAGLAGHRVADVHLLFAAMQHAFERDGHADFQVLPAGQCAPAAKQTIEEATASDAQPTQDVIEVDAAKQVLGREASDTGAASHIVFGPLLRVAQDRVGLHDLFEFLGGGRILVAVRMVF